jgi:hypothetical protein
MANEVTDTLQCEDQLAGVALLSAAQHRKRASTFGDPIHLHKRSSSLVRDTRSSARQAGLHAHPPALLRLWLHCTIYFVFFALLVFFLERATAV